MLVPPVYVLTAGAQTFIEKRQIIMIRVERTASGSRVTVNGKKIKFLEEDQGFVTAGCSFDKVYGVSSDSIPADLMIEIDSDNGFGTFLFHRVALIIPVKELLCMCFICYVPKKHWRWCGTWDLTTYLKALKDQVDKSERYEVTNQVIEDDLTFFTVLCSEHASPHKNIDKIILDAADGLRQLIKSTEKTLNVK